MKAYQSFLDDVWEFATSDGVVVAAVIVAIITVLVFSAKAGDNLAQKRAENVAWCLDHGGRRVAIDNITDCFQLTEVPLESETYEDQGRECTRVPTQTYIKAPGNSTLYFCYEFKRVDREN